MENLLNVHLYYSQNVFNLLNLNNMQFTEQFPTIIAESLDCIIVGKKGSADEFLFIYKQTVCNQKGILPECSNTYNKIKLMSAEDAVKFLSDWHLLNVNVDSLREMVRDHSVLQFLMETPTTSAGYSGTTTIKRTTLKDKSRF